MADGRGFEPRVPFGTHAFQACTIDRSVTHPKESSKFQAPSSKEIPSFKHHSLRHCRGANGRSGLFGAWDLELLWSLDVGAWCFPKAATGGTVRRAEAAGRCKIHRSRRRPR